MLLVDNDSFDVVMRGRRNWKSENLMSTEFITAKDTDEERTLILRDYFDNVTSN